MNHSLYAKCGKVRIGDFDWDSANFHTSLVSYILEEHYGCEVEIKKGSTDPIMSALFDGQIDLVVEVWEHNQLNQINDEIGKGNILHLGIINIASQKFYIDRKTAYKYNLETIDDMRNSNIAKLFDNKLISCISGWTCNTINFVKLKEYGLDLLYENYDPGSGGALDSKILSSFKNNKPIFTYYWEPTSLLGDPSVDLIPLKEPKYNSACWSNMMSVVNDIKSKGVSAYKPSCASEYFDMKLTKIVRKDFAINNLEIINFLKSYSVSTDEVNEMLNYYVQYSGGDMRKVAKHYINRNNEKVVAWLSGADSGKLIVELETEEKKIKEEQKRIAEEKKIKEEQRKAKEDNEKRIAQAKKQAEEERKAKEDKELFIIGSGTGFFVNKEGYIITNAHVAGICQSLASYINGETHLFRTIALDSRNDLALLRGEYRNKNFLNINPMGAEFGQDIMAFGFPLADNLSSSVKLTRGIVSSLSGPNNDISLIQIDAAIQPGNSGGPVLNYSGQVVGVASSGLNKAAMYEESSYIPENVNFAVSASTLTSFLKSNSVNMYNKSYEKKSSQELAKIGMPPTIQLHCLNTLAAYNKLQKSDNYSDVLLKKAVNLK